MLHHAIHYLLIVTLAATTLYMAVVCWLFGIMGFFDIDLATPLSAWEWTSAALYKAGFSLLIGLNCAGFSAAAIRGMKWLLRLSANRNDLWVAGVMGAIPALVGVSGAVLFFIMRPYALF